MRPGASTPVELLYFPLPRRKERLLNIRTYRPGDELAQVEVYNAAAASLPRFKAATRHEILRRIRAADFDPSSRLYAEKKGRVVAYATFQANGRVSYPWCLPGEESCADTLFDALLAAMRAGGLPGAWAAYRPDWTGIHQFFLARAFTKVRDICNYILDLVDMPTPSARLGSPMSPLAPADLPTLFDLGQGILRLSDVPALERLVFRNPLVPPESWFCLRSRHDGRLLAVGLLVVDSTFARPAAVDADMPCFRLGAFGTENLTHKRINGLFSFLARPDPGLNALAMDLLGQAAYRLRDFDDMESLAAQVPSDASHLLAFYERSFRRQGSFPVFERVL